MPPASPPGLGDMMGMITTLLAGAGFKHVSDGVNKLASSGVNTSSLMADPNMKLLLAGAGIRDTANSMDLVSPLMKMLMPPAPPQPPAPEDMNAAMQMISAKLGPGMTGLQPPATPPMGGVPMGPPPMGGGGGY